MARLLILRKLFPLFVYFGIFLLAFFAGRTQNLSFNYLNREGGLSNNNVYSISEDAKGFLWIGTLDGLNRYDGKDYKIYKTIPGDTNSISNNSVLSILKDSRNRLWFGTAYQVNLYNEKTDRFKRFAQTSDNSQYINFIYEDRSGRILLGTGRGINVYDEKSGQFNPIGSPQFQALISKPVLSIFQDSFGDIWIGTESGGLIKCDQNFQKVDERPIVEISKNQTITCITEDADKDLWIGTTAGLYNWDLSKKNVSVFTNIELNAFSISSNNIRTLKTLSNGQIWIGTENGGLNIYDKIKKTFTRHENDPAVSHSLSQKTISTIYEGQNGNVWLGSPRGGVNQYNPIFNRFQFFTQGIGPKFASFKDTKGFFESRDGLIYIATDGGGMNVLNRETGVFTHYTRTPGNGSISSNAVLSILGGSDDEIWVATWGGGLNSFNPVTKTFKKYFHSQESGSISSNNINILFEDRNNRLWVGTSYGGLNLLVDAKAGKFESGLFDGIPSSAINGKNITSIQEDNAGNLWLGTEDGGVCMLNFATKKVDHYFVYREKDGKISYSETVRLVFIDAKGRVWASHNGLSLFDPVKKVFSQDGIPEILKKENIQSIVEDVAGNFWIGTTNGLLKYNHTGKTLQRFTNLEGLQDLDYALNGALKLRSGEFIFGGYNGFNIFNPQSIITNAAKPNIYITGFNVGGKPYNIFNDAINNVVVSQKVPLKYFQNSLSIQFAALNYIFSSKNQYAYMLEGFDKAWQYVDNINTASYSNLEPGDYTFKVIAANNDGIWNQIPATLQVQISPPYWKTLWFKALVFCFLCGGVYVYFKLYKQLIKKRIEEKELEQVYNMKLDFFTHISHEFRTPLSLISGAAEQMANETNSLKSNKNYHLLAKNINRLSYLIKELMSFRKAESGVIKLNVSRENLNTVLESVAEDFVAVGVKKGIRFSHNSVDDGKIYWIDKSIIEKIVLNLLNNAFKYCRMGDAISIERFDSETMPVPLYRNNVIFGGDVKKKYTYFKISDSGIGVAGDSVDLIFTQYYRVPSYEMGSGIGLALVKSLTILHKGLLIFSSEENVGTEVIIGILKDGDSYSVDEMSETMNANSQNLIENFKLENEIDDVHETAVVKENKADPKLEDAPLILIVEDNDGLREFLKSSLIGKFNVITAVNGEEGIKKATEAMPSLIVTDVMMPRMDGFEMCRLLKGNDALKNTPIIMLTAKDSEEDKIAGAEIGIEHYFTKPLSINFLLLAIENILVRNNNLKLHYLKNYQTEIKETLHSSKDRELMDALLLLLEDKMDMPDLEIAYICREIGMSQSKLYKEIKRITGMSINEFIRHTRLKKATFIMLHEDVSITDVMNRVGIQSASYFTKAFTREFGKSPSAYQKEVRNVSKI